MIAFVLAMIDDLLAGDYFSGIARPYIDSMGDYFFIFLFGGIYVLTYLKTHSVRMVTVVCISTLGVTIPLFPAEAHPILYAFLALSLAATVTSAYLSR